MRFRVLSFNIGNGRADRAPLVALLRSGDWDVVALQEVSELQGRTLEGDLESGYPHRVIHPRGVAGKALLSRHLPVEAELEL